jgi:hypothetical protein
MRRFLRGIGRLTRPQKLIVWVLLALVLVTWLATCLVLTGVLRP